MGDEEKKKETAEKSGNNKDNHRRETSQRENDGGRSRRRSNGGHSRRRSRSHYGGSYVSGYENDSSDHSGVSNDDDSRHGQKRQEPKRTKKVKPRHGRVTKPKKRANKHTYKQKKKQLNRYARALVLEPEKALSISTIMTKASSKASSVTNSSNELCHKQVNPQTTVKIAKEVRISFVNQILRQMRANRNAPVTKLTGDADAMETDCQAQEDIDEEEIFN